MAVILVVDDSETECSRTSGLLENAFDHELLSATAGVTALDCMRENAVDLVITDLMMPGMDGIELIRALREEFPRVPIILMTGAGSEELAVKAIQEGATGYYSKQAPAKDLQTTVTRLLAARAEDLANAQILRQTTCDEYVLKLPSRRALMSAAAGLLRQRIQALAICPEKELLRLGVALEESLLNACLHGNLELDSTLREEDGDRYETLADQRSSQSPWKDRHVYVSASVTQEEARIVVRDEGSGFDPGSLPDPTDPENLLKPHGRGVMIMQLFLDEVTWNDRGNEVTMVKRADRSSGDQDG